MSTTLLGASTRRCDCVLCDLLLKYNIEALNPVSFVQTRKSHFIDSHYMNIWSGGGDLRVVDTRGGADRQFGSRVVHKIKNNKQRGDTFIIDGIHIRRLEVYEDPAANGRDMIECIVYGPAEDAE